MNDGNSKLTKRKISPTFKQKEWLRHTVTTKNPTEAARMAYNVKNDHTASVIASENLRKPYLRQALSEMLEEYGMVLKDTVKEHKWVIAQKKDIGAKMRGIQEHYELLGLHDKKNNEPPVNVGIVITRD